MESTDANERASTMRQVEHIELTVGLKRVIEFVQEGRCEKKRRVPCTADELFTLLNGTDEFLFLNPLEKVLFEV
jgi:hypothetical protein